MHKLPLLLAFIFSSSLFAADTISVSTESAWARATPPGTTNTAIYLTLLNHGATDVNLTGAGAQFSDRLELHTHTSDNGMMKMQQVESIEIPANSQVELKPHGNHIMVFNLSESLKVGESVKLNLVFDNQSELTVDVPVTMTGPIDSESGHSDMDNTKPEQQHDEHKTH